MNTEKFILIKAQWITGKKVLSFRTHSESPGTSGIRERVTILTSGSGSKRGEPWGTYYDLPDLAKKLGVLKRT